MCSASSLDQNTLMSNMEDIMTTTPTATIPTTPDTWAIMFGSFAANTTYVNHTATLLRNGKVLVAGGSGGSSLPGQSIPGRGTKMTQLFDPSTSTWTRTADLNVERPNDPTAVLLRNGQVLLIGGASSLPNISSSVAELYDPGMNTWTQTANMNFARAEQTATLLADGKVLAAGGTGSASTTAEIYNPADGTWTATTNPMTIDRWNHTATLLRNGQVLVTGGTGAAGTTATAELYDPKASTWTATTNPMTMARANHTATLLPNGQVLIVGGDGSSTSGTTAELYDPIAGTWTATTNQPSTSHVHHVATLLPNGCVLITGGGNPGSETAAVDLYIPRKNLWIAVSPMNYRRTNHTATLLSDARVFVVGGSGSITGVIQPGSLASVSSGGADEYYIPFPFQDQDAVAFLTDNGFYVSRINRDGGLIPLETTRFGDEAAMSQFVVSVLSNNQIALQADNGLYVSRMDRGTGLAPIEATKTSIDASCQFTVSVFPENRIALLADNGNYVSRINRAAINPIEAAKTNIDSQCQFVLRRNFLSATLIFYNLGADYDAWCHVNYKDPSGQALQWDSGKISKGQAASVEVPVGATDIWIEGGAMGADRQTLNQFNHRPSLLAGTRTVLFTGTKSAPTACGDTCF